MIQRERNWDQDEKHMQYVMQNYLRAYAEFKRHERQVKRCADVMRDMYEGAKESKDQWLLAFAMDSIDRIVWEHGGEESYLFKEIVEKLREGKGLWEDTEGG